MAAEKTMSEPEDQASQPGYKALLKLMEDADAARARAEQATAALRENEQRFRAFFETHAVGTTEIDVDGRLTAVNDRYCQITGYSREELLRMTIMEVTHPDDRERNREQLQVFFQGQTPLYEAEKRYLRKDGSIIWVQVTAGLVRDGEGKPLRSAGIVQDITARKQVNEALRASEARLRQVIDLVPHMIFAKDRKGRFLLANQAVADGYGMTVAQLIGTYHGELHPDPTEVERMLHADREVIDSGRPKHIPQETYLRTDGQHRVLETIKIPYTASGTGTPAILGVAVDITDRKRAEEELKAATISAEQARAVAEAASRAKDHFLAVLSHELRNPLNPVLATATMLRDDPRFDSDTREQLEVIRRNAELEAQLIDDLLDVTRIERGKVELERRTVDLRTILQRAVEVCMPDIEARKLEFGVDACDGPYWVDADAARLQQVFWNLIKNAIKFTPHGGRIGIQCRCDDGHVVTEVSDSGEGIEPDALERIFNAFEQAGRSITRQFGGLGLGLTISKAMVEMHGGSIRAYSQGKGEGATFTVKLPLLPVERAAAAIAPASALSTAKAPDRPLRILLVEDHGDTARVMRRLLSAGGHEVQSAADVTTALKLAEEQSFDLLLSDLGLPDGTGLDLMQALRKRGSRMPGIVLSGYGQDKDIEQSRKAGFSSHLTKPVDMRRLREAIEQVVS